MYQKLLIILFISFSSAAVRREEFKKLFLAENDRLCLDLDAFLPRENPTNSIEFKSSENQKFSNHKILNKSTIDSSKLPNDFANSIKLIKSRENLLVMMIEEQQESKLYFTKFEHSLDIPNMQSQALTVVSADCHDMSVTKSRVYLVCLQNAGQSVALVKKDISIDTAAQIEDFRFSLEDEESLSSEKLRLDHYDNGINELFLFHFKNSKNVSLKNQFYITDFVRRSLITLESDLTIQKIVTISYNKSKKEAILLAHVDTPTGSELRHLQIVDFALVVTKEIRVITTNFSKFHFVNGMIITISPSENGLEITSVTLQDLSKKVFLIKGQTELVDVYNNQKFYCIISKSATGNEGLTILDTNNQRFANYPLNEPNVKHRAIIQSGHSSFILQFLPNKIEALELYSLKYICHLKDEKPIETELIEVHDANKEIFKFEVKRIKFTELFIDISALRSLDILNTNILEYYYLNLHGNDMKLTSEQQIIYFNQLSFTDNTEFQCSPILISFSSNKYAKLCPDGTIEYVPKIDFNFEELSLSVDEKFVIQAKLDSSKALFAKIFFNEYLLILSNTQVIHYTHLVTADKATMLTNDILLNYNKCFLNSNYFICQNEGDPVTYFVRIFHTKDGLAFKVEYEVHIPNVVFETISVSTFDPDVIFYFTNDNGKVGFEQRNMNSLVSFSIPEIASQITSDTNVIQLYIDEFVIISVVEGNAKIIGLIGGSFIEYPFSSVEFKKIIDFSFSEFSKTFAILYQTVFGQTKLYVGRSSLFVADRNIQEIDIVSESDQLNLEIDMSSNHRIIFYVTDMQTGIITAYAYFSYGPLYVLKPGTHINAISLSINNHLASEYITNNDYAQIRAPSVETKEISITDAASGVIEYKLESTGNVNLKGDVYSLAFQGGAEKGFVIEPRVMFEKQWTLLQSDNLNYKSAIALSSNADGFVLFYKDSLYTPTNAKTNKDYKHCQKIDSDSDDVLFRDIFACNEKSSSSLILTNLDAISIDLDEQNLDISRSKLIKIDNEIYFASSLIGHRSILLWKLYYEVETSKSFVEMRKVIYPDEFFTDSNYINYFNMFVHGNEVIIFTISSNEGVIRFKRIDRKNNLLDISTFVSEFLPEKSVIYNAECDLKSDQIECLVHSDDFIYDVNILPSNFHTTIKAKYLFTIQFVTFRRVKLSFSQHFLFVSTKNFESTELIIYKRFETTSNDQIGFVYGSIQLSPNSITKCISSFESPTDHSIKVYLAIFEKNEAGKFTKLKVESYFVDELKLKMDPKLAGYKNVIMFETTDSKNHVARGFLTVILQSNFKLYLLLIILLALLLIFFVLTMFVLSLRKNNKKLQEEIDRKKMDTSSFLEKTYMQV